MNSGRSALIRVWYTRLESIRGAAISAPKCSAQNARTRPRTAKALRDGLEFQVTFLPTDSYRPTSEPFERAYMVELFERAYDLAAAGYPWSDAPPGFETARIAVD